mgnify:CR=1 FL=1
MIDLSSLYHPDDEEYLPFQRAGITELALRPHILLGDEMGLGKTIQVIGYLNLARPASVLIVCPNNLRLNWLNEIDKWMDPSLRETYDIEQCTTSLFIPTNFVVASYEGLTRWSLALKECKWDVLVADEAHYVKNLATKRSKALFEFRDLVSKKILLTGTPICNYPYELFPLINFLDERQWPSKAAFERRYCPYGNKYGYHLAELQDLLRNGTHFRSQRIVKKRVAARVRTSTTGQFICQRCDGAIFESAAVAENHVVETGHTVSVSHSNRESIVPGEEIEVSENVDERGCGLMVRRLKKEVLPELPRKRRQIIELPAEGELLQLVEEENALWKTQSELILQLEQALGLKQETEDEDDFHKMIESMKFNRQYFFNEISIIRHKLALAKVPYVVDHITDLLENKDKLVVFVHHNDVARAIFEPFADKAVLVYGPTSMEERAAHIDRFWKDDKCELFIGSLKTSGLGLNLQIAANIVFAELDWVPGVITQAEDRCHRIGQEKSLLVQHLVAANSMDSNMAKRIVAKQKTIQKALNRQETSNV